MAHQYGETIGFSRLLSSSGPIPQAGTAGARHINAIFMAFTIDTLFRLLSCVRTELAERHRAFRAVYAAARSRGGCDALFRWQPSNLGDE